jgi:hypothetical protein
MHIKKKKKEREREKDRNKENMKGKWATINGKAFLLLAS